MVVIDMYHTFSAYLISVQLYKENVRFWLEYHRNYVLLVHLIEEFIILVYLIGDIDFDDLVMVMSVEFLNGKIFFYKLDLAGR